MTLSLAVAAERYASHGWPVFPLRSRDKRPLHEGAGGFHEATTDLSLVRAWWRAAPASNVGHVPGGAGHLVLDVDGPEGARSAVALDSLAGDTLTVATGEGEHRYYRAPADLAGRIGNAVLAPQLDLRGDAGYVLLPPSVHPSGTVYRWRRAPVADAPPALVDELRRRFAPRPAPRALPRNAPAGDHRVASYLARVPVGLADGRKRSAFVLAAALLHDLGCPPREALAILEAWNACNAPPLASAYLGRVLVNAAKHGGRRGRAA